MYVRQTQVMVGQFLGEHSGGHVRAGVYMDVACGEMPKDDPDTPEEALGDTGYSDTSVSVSASPDYQHKSTGLTAAYVWATAHLTDV